MEETDIEKAEKKKKRKKTAAIVAGSIIGVLVLIYVGICHILQQPFHVLYEDQWDGLLSEKRKPGGGLYEAAGGGLCLNA